MFKGFWMRSSLGKMSRKCGVYYVSKQASCDDLMKILPCAHCVHLSDLFHALFNKASANLSKTASTWETLTKSLVQELRFPARHDIFMKIKRQFLVQGIWFSKLWQTFRSSAHLIQFDSIRVNDITSIYTGWAFNPDGWNHEKSLQRRYWQLLRTGLLCHSYLSLHLDVHSD